MGGVRGDVMRLGFIQTTIMEMGQPPSVSTGDAGAWVHSRQFTGRIVTVSNAKISADPVFNYSRDFPFIWEEMIIPITYRAGRSRAEAIMLEAASLHAERMSEQSEEKKAEMQQRFGVEPIEFDPQVYYRLTDNWLELTGRFIVGTHRIRGIKNAMSRHIITEFDKAGLASPRRPSRSWACRRWSSVGHDRSEIAELETNLKRPCRPRTASLHQDRFRS